MGHRLGSTLLLQSVSAAEEEGSSPAPAQEPSDQQEEFRIENVPIVNKGASLLCWFADRCPRHAPPKLTTAGDMADLLRAVQRSNNTSTQANALDQIAVLLLRGQRAALLSPLTSFSQRRTRGFSCSYEASR
jgi:hypothetical protein